MFEISIILLAFTGIIVGVEQNVVHIGNKDYLIFEQNLNWFKAAHFCHSINADLATIESASELLAVSNYLNDNSKGDDWYWIDANDLGEDGKYYSLTTGRLTFTEWASKEPNNLNGKQHCICLRKKDKNFKMNDRECESAAYFICKPREQKCLEINHTTAAKHTNDTFTFLEEQLLKELRQDFEQIGDDFYYFGKSRVNRHTADQRCRSRGSNLVNIESIEEFEALGKSLISKRRCRQGLRWIDGIDADHNGSFASLTNGTPLNTKDFDIIQVKGAQGSCVAIRVMPKQIVMFDVSCEFKTSYICKARKPEFVNVYGSPINIRYRSRV